MKKIFLILTVLFIGLANIMAQTVKDIAIVLKATPSGNSSINLEWEAISNATSYDVFRRELHKGTWSAVSSNLSGTSTSYIDNTVVEGVAYEYYIRKNNNNSSYRGYGYVSSGINVPAKKQSGDLLLIVDSTAYSSLTKIIQDTLIPDLIGDGWHVKVEQVGRSQSGTEVKSIIQAWYGTGVVNPTVYLFGHVPVVYSGGFQLDTINGVAGLNSPPDGHVPQHCGAWATDCYYADMGGVWTDANTYDFNVNNSWGKNFPGDGKFDQHRIPDKSSEISIGRVDLFDLPAIDSDEMELLKNYIRKAHKFRHQNIDVDYKALISDRLNWFKGEAPGRTGWMNYSGIVGKDNIVANTDYFNHLKTNDYLFSQVTSTASYTSISGIGSVSLFKDSVRAVFNSYFGSYFGDWNIKNNFLRGCLAAKNHTLTSIWNGRPSWYFHSLGMGGTIGEAAKVSQSNSGDYFIYNNFINGVHINLMGDPSLRIHTIKPASNFSGTSDVEREVNLTWTKSTDQNVLGYYVYRADKGDKNGNYELIHEDIITSTQFTDKEPWFGENFYMVRPVKLEKRASGSYFNVGQGIFCSVKDVESGNFYLSENEITNYEISIFPNPANERLQISINNGSNGIYSIHNALGQEIITSEFSNNSFHINSINFKEGLYILKIKNSTGFTSSSKFIIARD